MNIAIMRAFVEIRRLSLKQNDLKIQLDKIKHRLSEHDIQLNSIYDAIENLLDEKAAQRKWDERERISSLGGDSDGAFHLQAFIVDSASPGNLI